MLHRAASDLQVTFVDLCISRCHYMLHVSLVPALDSLQTWVPASCARNFACRTGLKSRFGEQLACPAAPRSNHYMTKPCQSHACIYAHSPHAQEKPIANCHNDVPSTKNEGFHLRIHWLVNIAAATKQRGETLYSRIHQSSTDPSSPLEGIELEF